MIRLGTFSVNTRTYTTLNWNGILEPHFLVEFSGHKLKPSQTRVFLFREFFVRSFKPGKSVVFFEIRRYKRLWMAWSLLLNWCLRIPSQFNSSLPSLNHWSVIILYLPQANLPLPAITWQTGLFSFDYIKLSSYKIYISSRRQTNSGCSRKKMGNIDLH